MKKLRVILIVLFIAAMLAVGASGCFLLHDHSSPDSMEIDGETYVKGFYGDLYVVGIAYRESQTAEFESTNHYWWNVEGAPFELYCAQNKEAMLWNPTVYCKQSEYEEVKAYYADVSNYDYYIGGWEEGEPRIQLSESDGTDYAERAIQFKDGITGSIFDKNNKRLVTVDGVDWFDWYRAVIYHVSKDGLFTTERSEWAICNDNLYIAYDSDDDKHQTTFYYPDEDVSNHIVALFKKYQII